MVILFCINMFFVNIRKINNPCKIAVKSFKFNIFRLIFPTWKNQIKYLSIQDD